MNSLVQRINQLNWPSIQLSVTQKNVLGLMLVAFVELFVTSATCKLNGSAPHIMRFSPVLHFCFWTYVCLGIAVLVGVVKLASNWLTQSARESQNVFQANLLKIGITGGIVAFCLAGTLNFAIMFMYTFLQHSEFEIPTPAHLADASPWISTGICVLLAFIEEFGKLFGLFFIFRALFLLPYQDKIGNGEFPCVRKLFLVCAGCVGLGFATLENFLYTSHLVVEKSHSTYDFTWGEFHTVNLTRIVQSVHPIWTVLSAVIFLRLGGSSLPHEELKWEFEPERVFKSIASSWLLHALFNISLLFFDRHTTIYHTIAWALTLALANFCILRTLSRRYFRNTSTVAPTATELTHSPEDTQN